MSKLNRRTFMQVAGAAGLAPLLPALPARATAGGAASAKMLWASLAARAGNINTFRQVTQSIGLSTSAVEGVYAKLVQTQVLSAHGANALNRPAPTALRARPIRPAAKTAKLRPDTTKLKKLIKDKLIEEPQTPDIAPSDKGDTQD